MKPIYPVNQLTASAYIMYVKVGGDSRYDITAVNFNSKNNHEDGIFSQHVKISELNVDNWNDNCKAKSEAKSPRPLRGLQVDSSLTRNVPYAVR